jgi:TolB-like protein
MRKPTPINLQRRRAAILFADVANYSRMMSIDEMSTTVEVRARIRLFRDMLTDYAGELVDTAGDGVFLVFESAAEAVSYAVKIQRALLDLNEGIEPSKQVWFRVGINIGEVLFDDDGELSGDSINIASRIEGFARPGRICISGAVYEDVSVKLGFGYEYLGAQEFKNIGKSVDVFLVHEDPASATMATGLRSSCAVSEDEVARDQSIVVLPFTFQGGDMQESWFADGLSEDITTNLSRFQEFFVIARGSAFVYRDKAIPPANIGRELGVRYVVNGSVRKSGSRIRVALQLLDALRDKTIWGEQYNRDVEDLFDLQDEITQIIVSATAAKIHDAERERLRQLPPSNLEAYGFVLKGQSHVVRYTKVDVRQARGLYNAALATDPRYARALSAKSRTLNLDWRYNWASEPEQALSEAMANLVSHISIARKTTPPSRPMTGRCNSIRTMPTCCRICPMRWRIPANRKRRFCN